jgi:hypothetical protein
MAQKFGKDKKRRVSGETATATAAIEEKTPKKAAGTGQMGSRGRHRTHKEDVAQQC